MSSYSEVQASSVFSKLGSGITFSKTELLKAKVLRLQAELGENRKALDNFQRIAAVEKATLLFLRKQLGDRIFRNSLLKRNFQKSEKRVKLLEQQLQAAAKQQAVTRANRNNAESLARDLKEVKRICSEEKERNDKLLKSIQSQETEYVGKLNQLADKLRACESEVTNLKALNVRLRRADSGKSGNVSANAANGPVLGHSGADGRSRSATQKKWKTVKPKKHLFRGHKRQQE